MLFTLYERKIKKFLDKFPYLLLLHFNTFKNSSITFFLKTVGAYICMCECASTLTGAAKRIERQRYLSCPIPAAVQYHPLFLYIQAEIFLYLEIFNMALLSHVPSFMEFPEHNYYPPLHPFHKMCYVTTTFTFETKQGTALTFQIHISSDPGKLIWRRIL